ncbi:1-acyl-sn-glycerol-3-phosphate acyltransferase alpha-like isoform X2 [Anguilla rostrata]|uniref:1-acyl-sn-glycerol-3-phosphate acyltransferase alpha-like isoform X2 n=1 Tax=Anguilla rostrata TaxID=7938 RepID=UPI0030D24B1D
MDVLWISLLAVPVLLWSSGTFLFYFKTILYFVSMVCLAVVTIPMCILKSGGRNVENMRVIRFLVQHVKYLMGLRFVVSGRENLQVDGPYVIISNHQSSLDVLGQMEVLPDRCVSVAKRELLLTGAVGLACWLGGTIFINRKKTDDAKSIMAATARTMLKDQVRLWVFPEGTRNHEGDLLPFKKGAFHLAVQAQVPIVPVVFSSYNSFYSPREKQFKSGTIKLRILPAIKTKGLVPHNVSTLSNQCYNLMRSVFAEISDATAGPSQ